jgi:CheY-like chemotaxis protein
MTASTVLIVEDNSDLALAMKALLRISGVEATCAVDGATALRLLRSGLPALVLLDVNMPVRSGLDILSDIRADPSLSNARVVVYTAIDDAELRREAMKLGALAYIVKGTLDAGVIAELVHKYAKPGLSHHLHATEGNQGQTSVQV